MDQKKNEDQINQRVKFVSEEIDEEYEEDRSLQIVQHQDAENFLQMKMSFIFDKSDEFNSDQDNLQEVSESTLNSNVSRSGLIPQTKSINSMCSQINFCYIDQFLV